MGNVKQSKRLADAVETRRRELGMSPSDLQERTGLSAAALLNVRRGDVRRYQERLTRPLTKALGWTPDSIDRLLAGKPPTLVVDAPPHSWNGSQPTADDLVAAVREAIAEGQERSMKMDEVVETVNQAGETLAELAAQVAKIAEFVRRREAALSHRPGELE